MAGTVSSTSSKLMLSVPKSEISYVCSNCGTLLYHSGSGSSPWKTEPVAAEVAERMKTCPEWAHKHKPEPEEDVTMTKSNSL